MTPFVTADELADYMEVDEIGPNAQLMLDAAQRTVRNYVGQELTLHVDDVELHDGRGRRVLRLRERPVREVSQLKVNGTVVSPSSYTVDGSVIKLTDGSTFNVGLANIEVTYTHGWDLADDDSGEPELLFPADIKLVTLSVARRRLNDSGESASATLAGETMGSYSYTNDSTAVEHASGLLEAERYVLDAYRIGLVI